MSIQSEIDRIQNNVAETYDALEEQGATMPTQKNSDNMAATARTISTSSGGTTVQADLAVNDSTNPRYVKNRTHWKEVYDGPEGEIIPETALEFKGNFNFGTLSGGNGGIQLGGLYIVTHNGTEYRCVAMDSGDGAYIGNGSLLGYGDLEDTGEPFCILGLASTVFTLYKPDKTAETVTVKVVGKKETVWHKLDSKYLNEALQFGAGELVEVLPETTATIDPEIGSGILPAVLDVIAENTYTVNWNGTEFVCIAQVYTENDIPGVCLGNLGVITGGTDTGEPFVIVCFDATTAAGIGAGVVFAPLDGSASVTLSITGEVVKTIDPKYLPKSLQFGETVKNLLPETTLEIDWENMGGAVPYPSKIGLIVGTTYAVRWNGAEYNCMAQNVYVPNGTDDGGTLYIGVGIGNVGAMTGGENTGEPFAIVDASPLVEAESGAPCAIQVLDESTTSVTLSITGAAIKKLDNKYLDLEWTPSKKLATRVEVFPENTVDAAGDTIPLTEEFMACAENKAPYVVTWNGVEYTCTGLTFGVEFAIGNLYMINPDLAPDTGEPFLFFATGQNLIIFYMDEGAVTFKIDRAYYDTLPYEFAPANYTIPTDMKANSSQTNGEELIYAEYVLNHGGKVFGTVDGSPVEIVSLWADSVDNFNYFTWRDLSKGAGYGDIYTMQGGYNDWKSMTPAVDRMDILLRYNNSSSGINTAPKKFKFTVDENGNLMSSNEDGTNQKKYLTESDGSGLNVPVTSADNGKFLRVVDGAWAAVALTDVSEVGA